MAKEDFCFTYYDGDAARDMQHMDRLARGGYGDLILSQRKFGHLSLNFIKRILGKDYEECWPQIEIILLKDDAGLYFIEWLENSIIKASKHSRKQKKNGEKGGRPTTNFSKKDEKTTQKEPIINPLETHLKPIINPNISQKKPLGDGYGDEDGNGDEDGKDRGVGEDIFFKDGTLIGEMKNVFTRHNPNYPADMVKDAPALLEIAKFLCQQAGVRGSPVGHMAKVLEAWEPLSSFIAAEKFWCQKPLQSLSKHIQEIVQKARDGDKSQKKANTGATAADIQAEFNRRYGEK